MELYEFATPRTDDLQTVARYTSGPQDIDIGGNIYEAIGIERGEISFDFDKNELSVNLPMDVWPVTDFRVVNPYGVVSVTIYNELQVVKFRGRVKACVIEPDKGSAKLLATSIQEILDSQVPVKTYSPTCPYELFGGNCGVDSETYKLAVTFGTSTITSTTITNVAFLDQSDGYYAGGWVETLHERVTILEHTSDTLTVMYGLHELGGADDEFLIYPGCNKLLTTCGTKYSNSVAFGGFPYVPETNPVTEEF